VSSTDSDHLIEKIRSVPLKDAAYRLVYYRAHTYPTPDLTQDDCTKLLASVFSTVGLPEITRAYRAAMKLEEDHLTYFSYRDDGDYGKALIVAENKARALNPGFSDETYRAAGYSLGIKMR
jgi:hypothetical protein